MPYKDPIVKRLREQERARIRRTDWLEENGPCKCGSKEKLEVDHINPKLKVSHRIWSWSDARRKLELLKCQVLCHDCHVKKTWADRPRAKHGTHSMYSMGCRCNDCRNSHAALAREYRKNTGT